MNLALISSAEFEVTLDTVQVDDRIPSVAFDVTANLHLPFQTANVTIKQCWFTHAALNEFEQQLSALRSQESGAATLLNMSDCPILKVMRQGDEIKMSIQASDTVGMSLTTIEMNSYASEIAEIYEHLHSCAKWW
jgi:hypothetical protein